MLSPIAKEAEVQTEGATESFIMKAMGATEGFDTMKTLGKTFTPADIVRLLKFIVFISCSSFLLYLLTLRQPGLTFSQKKKHKLFLCGTLYPLTIVSALDMNHHDIGQTMSYNKWVPIKLSTRQAMMTTHYQKLTRKGNK